MTDPDWLGLQQRTADTYTVELDAAHARFDGQFYGGAGLALFTAALARRTGRHPLWVTTQFISSAVMGETVECHIELLAEGHLSTQARMTAMVGDRMMLAGLGAAAIDRPDGLTGSFGDMPTVRAPEDSDSWTFLRKGQTETERFGPMLTAEFRRARSETGITRLWARMAGQSQTAESLAYLADIVPAGVVRAAGRAGAGVSLDNTVRFGPPPQCDWVLLDVDPYFAHNGFVHGATRVWSPDGVLLAVASQTARALLFD